MYHAELANCVDAMCSRSRNNNTPKRSFTIISIADSLCLAMQSGDIVHVKIHKRAQFSWLVEALTDPSAKAAFCKNFGSLRDYALADKC